MGPWLYRLCRDNEQGQADHVISRQRGTIGALATQRSTNGMLRSTSHPLLALIPPFGTDSATITSISLASGKASKIRSMN